MRIIKQTPTQLILQNRDAKSFCIIGLILLGISFGFLFRGLSSPVKDSLICNRAESNKINCSLTKFYLNGSRTNKKINELKGAAIKEHHSGRKKNYEVILQTKVSEVSLLTNADGGSQKLVTSVNDFVALPQQSTLQLQATAWGNLIHSIFVVLLGFGACSGVILVASIKTCTFDKNLNQVIFQEKSLIKKQELRFPLDKILALRVQKADRAYNVILAFKNSECLRLVTASIIQRPAVKIVEKIENFLGIRKT